MGWDFVYGRPVGGAKCELDRQHTWSRDTGAKSVVLKSAMVGSTYYAAVKQTRPDGTESIFASVCLTSMRRGEFGTKDMEESMGPCESQCPLSILALLPPTDSEYANNWRQRCRDYAAAKSARPKLAAGTVLRYGPHHYRLADPAGPRRGWRVSCIETGSVYRMNARQLNAASAVDPASLPAFQA